MLQAIRSVFRNYANFGGRARHAEAWWFALAQLLGLIAYSMLLTVASNAVGPETSAGTAVSEVGGAIGSLALLGLILPNLAVEARRLHDADLSAAWLLLWLIPWVGWLALLIMLTTAGTPGPNRFGPDPRGREGAIWWLADGAAAVPPPGPAGPPAAPASPSAPAGPATPAAPASWDHLDGPPPPPLAK